jgi:hypothetical protein
MELSQKKNNSVEALILTVLHFDVRRGDASVEASIAVEQGIDRMIVQRGDDLQGEMVVAVATQHADPNLLSLSVARVAETATTSSPVQASTRKFKSPPTRPAMATPISSAPWPPSALRARRTSAPISAWTPKVRASAPRSPRTLGLQPGAAVAK